MGSRHRVRKRRGQTIGRAHGAPADSYGSGPPDPLRDLHEERLATVSNILIDNAVRTVLDLGCGSGALLERLLADERFTRLVGVDTSIQAVQQAEHRLNEVPGGEPDRLRVLHGSFTTPDTALCGFDAAAMIETIEHVPPERLSAVERVVFAEWNPSLVVITTPNREYNVRLGMADDEFRHPDHRFEWCRARFRRWASGVAARNGYHLECRGVGPRDPLLGSPTQVGIFRRATEH
jgi:small RNA 2'-O-methyltransferase